MAKKVDAVDIDEAGWEVLIYVLKIIIENFTSIPFLLFLFQFHLMRRFFESVFITNYSYKIIRWHLVIAGFIYYIGACLTVGIVELKYRLFMLEDEELVEDMNSHRISGEHMMGIFVFILANYFQNTTHFSLALLREENMLKNEKKRISNLKKNKKNWNNAKPLSKKRVKMYFVPKGGWFDYIFSPHYLFEIIIYFSLAMVNGFRSFSIMAKGAYDTKIWYQKKFKRKCPKNRKILIPYIW